MARLIVSVLFMALAGFAPARAAQSDLVIVEAGDVTLEQFVWTARPLVLFADSPNDPRLAEQLRLLGQWPADLLARDVVVITDTDPAAQSAIRRTLRPRGFQLVLIDKDGAVKLRKPAPWSSREIARAIDKMPTRIQEIRDGKARLQ